MLVKKKLDPRIIISFVLATLFLIFKARYGFGEVDEPLVLSIPYRMANGDILFFDEWNLSQMAAILQYPLMKLFLLLSRGSTEGIILWHRFAYIAVGLICSLALFIILKKYSVKMALFFSLFIYLFAPANIMQMYYNTMGMLFMLFALIIIYEDKKVWLYYLAGLFLASACLCNPYLVVVYIYIFILLIVKNRWKNIPAFLLGAGTLFLIWVYIVFSRNSLNVFLESLTYMLVGDAGHTGGLIKKPITFLIEFFYVYKGTLWATAMYILLFFIRNKVEKKYISVLSKIVCFIHFPFVLDFRTFNPVFISIPLSLYGLFYIITHLDEKRIRILEYIYIPGALYGFLLHVASDNGLSTIAIAGTSTMLATVFAISIGDQNETRENKIDRYMNYLLFLEAIILLFVWRTIGVYWNDPIWEQNTVIDYGPEKGIIVSSDRAKEYDDICSDINALDSSKKTLFFTSRTWMYLDDRFENCSYSAWIWNISYDTIARFAAYYGINSNKKAEVVYIDYTNAALAQYWEFGGYKIIRHTPSGGVVLVENNDKK